MRLLHHYPTLSHPFLRNATRLFGLYIDYCFIAVHASQRKKKTAVFHNERPLCFTTKETAAFHNEKRPTRFTTKKTAAFYNEKKAATFHNGAVLSENTN